MMVTIIMEIKHAYPNHAACTRKWCSSRWPTVGPTPKVRPLVRGATGHRRMLCAARRDANVPEANAVATVLHRNPRLAAS